MKALIREFSKKISKPREEVLFEEEAESLVDKRPSVEAPRLGAGFVAEFERHKQVVDHALSGIAAIDGKHENGILKQIRGLKAETGEKVSEKLFHVMKVFNGYLVQLKASEEYFSKPLQYSDKFFGDAHNVVGMAYHAKIVKALSEYAGDKEFIEQVVKDGGIVLSRSLTPDVMPAKAH